MRLLAPGILLVVLLLGASTVLVAATSPPSGPAGWSQVLPSSRPNPWQRYAATLGYDQAGGDGFVFGGVGPGDVTLNDTWVNDGDFPGQWTEVSDERNVSPPALSGAAAAYDGADGYFVMFGGRLANGSAYGGTWEFVGLHQWVPVRSLASPPPEAGMSLAYDATSGMIVLLTSVGNGSTWTFHAGSWRPLPTLHGPSARSGAAFLEDPSLNADLLLGGVSGGAPCSDVWEFAGGTWTQRAVGPSPTAPGNLSASYDPRVHAVLAVAGSGPTTWQFGPDAWSQVAGPAAGGPSGRSQPSLYFDNAVGFDVLFGGRAANGTSVESDAWGWAIPVPASDPTVSPVPFSPVELGLIVLLVAVPVALAVFLRRRPPRRSPVSAPRMVPA